MASDNKITKYSPLSGSDEDVMEDPGVELTVNDVKLHRGPGDVLVATGARKSKVKFCIFVILCVITFPITPLLYFLLGFWQPRWKTLMTHSLCPCQYADKVLIKERKKHYRAQAKRIYLDKNDNYLLQQLGEHADKHGSVLMVEYKLDKYILTESSFQRVRPFGFGETYRTLTELGDVPLKGLRLVFGSNVLDVPLKPIIWFVLTEILTFFYIFQLFSCIVWYNNQYEVYATVIIVMSVMSASSTTYLSRSAIIKLRNAVLYECEVDVKRNGKIETIRSGGLVPGDIVRIPVTPSTLSFDGVLLNGHVVVDEAMLTGESVPTLKNPLPRDRLDEQYFAEKSEVNTVFSGTKILQTRPPADDSVYCIVTRTGFDTKKGETVKFMLHPKKSQKFKFYSEAWTYIKIMAVIGLAGVIYNIYDNVQNKYPAVDAVVGSLDLITIIIAPSLPLALSIAVAYAIRRLKLNKIEVALPNSINIAGKVKMCVFDKTGTLTEEGLTLHCVRASAGGCFTEDSTAKGGCFTEDTTTKGGCFTEDTTMLVLANCHSLSVIQGVVCGDPIDLIGFQSTGFEFDSTPDNTKFTHPTSATNLDPGSGSLFGLVRLLPFESHLKRMSVVCEGPGGALHVFSKGAPEQVVQHCDPATIPGNFGEVLGVYSSQGYRVIGLASRTLHSASDVMLIGREELESGLQFRGLLVMSNKLKPETRPVVEELKSAGVRTVMCTGDNLLTAICVGKDSSMIPDNADLYVVTAGLAESGDLEVRYEKQGPGPPHGLVLEAEELYDGPYRRVHLAMNGATFSLIAQHDPRTMDKVCVTGTIFARFSPEQKMTLIDELQQRSYSVCMCGDGANDCEALQHSNVGIALSKCEASLAAPFTSSIFNITCVPTLLKEGQGALEGSMAVFRFTAMYSITQYLSVMLLIQYNSILGDYQYLLEDLAIVLLFDFALGYTEPCRKLSRARPRGSLLHPFTLYSFILQTGLVAGFVVLQMVLVRQQSWYDPFTQIREGYLEAQALYVPYFETTVNFIHHCYQYIIIALVFSIGHPHRRPVYTNTPMVVATALAVGFVGMVQFVPPAYIPKLELAEIPSVGYKFAMIGLVLCNLVLALCVEYSWRLIRPLQRFLKLFRCKSGHKNRFKFVIDELEADGKWPDVGDGTKIEDSDLL